ncbi:NAD-dependent epimerase/dehydratase family protein [Catenulispora rubra]|uniref:NAD-dependent epimerase/dehydratase family protein n=1 Tax=Catenulispora rubra TaxID=280293 RepID=UPI002B26C850|nr:NAD(P)-dependent oxidoreductase [Catenulispora rubra]
MTEHSPSKTVLITGIAGGVGALVRDGLADLGWTIRGFDLAAPSEPGEDWIVGDITDAAALDEAMAGVDAVIHLAGIPVEARFPKILHVNIFGTYEVFEAARRAGVRRVVYASSNHAVGYHRRADFVDEDVSVDVRPRPDTYYGVSKIFGEALGSFYADRHDMSVACVRIGACYAQPFTRRMLATWLSPGDAVRLFNALLVADFKYEIVYGVSANTRAWWDLAPARRLGFEPKDDSEVHAAELLAGLAPQLPDDPEAVFLGGDFTVRRPD